MSSVKVADRVRDLARLDRLCNSIFTRRPLILVSNRGPVEHQMSPEGRPEPRRGSGSVVTAFNLHGPQGPFHLGGQRHG